MMMYTFPQFLSKAAVSATLFVLMLLCVAATPAAAQSSLNVLLLDNQTYKPIAGHRFVLENEAIGYRNSFTTNENGRRTIPGLSTSGEYVVRVPETETYFESQSEAVQLISNQQASVAVTVFQRVTADLDEVSIIASSTNINLVDAQVASELSAGELTRLPVEARDITRALYRLPNISQATGFYPEAPNVSINGANSLFTNYQIDGFDNNENFLGGQRFRVPVGLTQNITALTNNFSAEYGRTSNGVINITTKSGSNELEGEVYTMTRPGPPLDASSSFAQRDLSGNQVKDGFARYQGGFSVGGPIKKDQTFFFLNAEHMTDVKDNLLRVPQLGVNETVPGNNHFTLMSGRLDHNWNGRLSSSLRANFGLVSIERQGGGLDGGVTFRSAGNQQDRNSLMLAQRTTYRGDGFISETGYQFGRFRWNYANPEQNNSPNVSVFAPNDERIANIGHPGFVFDDTENTHQIQQKFSFFTGRHVLKTGVDFRTSHFALRGGGNPNGSWQVRLSEAQLEALRSGGVSSDLRPEDLPSDVEVLSYGVELRPNAFEKRQNMIALYVEDQFSLGDRLSVNAGLRYDYDNLSKAGADQGDLNNIAPRLSLNYRLSERSSLRAGYGMYYDKILYTVYSDALQFSSEADDFRRQLQLLIDEGLLPGDTDLDAITHEGNLVGSLGDVDYLQAPDRSTLQQQRESVFSNELRVLNPDGMDNPYSHQFMIGVQHQLGRHARLYADLMHNRSFNLYRLRDLNAPAPWPIDPQNVEVRSPEVADATRPTPIFQDAEGFYTPGTDGERLRGVARSVTMTETAGRSNYYALNLTYDQARGPRDFSWRLIYTLSYLENNTEDLNFRAMDANDFEDEWGPSLNDRRHMINATLQYFPVSGLSVALTTLLQSGLPVNRLADASIYGTSDLNGDGRSIGQQFVGNSDRSPGLSRNSDRLPWSTVFDLNLRYQLQLEGHQFELGADVFNLLNAENLSGFSANLTQSNQIQVGRSGRDIRNVSPPRQFQFSLRYLF